MSQEKLSDKLEIIMSDGLTLEKLKIDERLREVEKHMAEGTIIRQQIVKQLEHCANILDKIEERMESLDKRVTALESTEKERKKAHDGMMTIAVGAITMAIGTFMVWFFKTLTLMIK